MIEVVKEVCVSMSRAQHDDINGILPGLQKLFLRRDTVLIKSLMLTKQGYVGKKKSHQKHTLASKKNLHLGSRQQRIVSLYFCTQTHTGLAFFFLTLTVSH